MADYGGMNQPDQMYGPYLDGSYLDGNYQNDEYGFLWDYPVAALELLSKDFHLGISQEGLSPEAIAAELRRRGWSGIKASRSMGNWYGRMPDGPSPEHGDESYPYFYNRYLDPKYAKPQVEPQLPPIGDPSLQYLERDKFDSKAMGDQIYPPSVSLKPVVNNGNTIPPVPANMQVPDYTAPMMAQMSTFNSNNSVVDPTPVLNAAKTPKPANMNLTIAVPKISKTRR